VKATTIAAINARLADANGKRRLRTLTMADVRQAIVEAAGNGSNGYVVGGRVANAYNYRAYQTLVFAGLRTDGGARLRIWEADAHRAYGLGAMIGVYSRKPERIWAEVRDWADGEPAQRDLILTRAEVRRVVREYALPPAETVALPADVSPDTIVTYSHSIESGNCKAETDRVADALRAAFPGRDTITAGELVAWTGEHYPRLARFAIRAATYAARHH